MHLDRGATGDDQKMCCGLQRGARLGCVFTTFPLRVVADGVELQLRQTLSEAASTDTGVNNSPTLLNREVSTTVTMKDGDAVILGGLTSSRTTDNERGQSWLPKFLRASSKEKASTELVVFLRLSRVKVY